MAESESNIFDEFESAELDAPGWDERLRQWLDLWVLSPGRIMWTDRRTRYGSIIILFYLFMGTVGVRVVDSPSQNEHGPYLGMFQDWAVPLGTGHMGRDLLELTVHATPAMLKMMIAGGVATTLVGAMVGLIAGYKRGNVERVLMTAADTQMAIPGLPILIVLAVAIQPEDPFVVGLILSVDAWSGLARTLHSQILSIRNESYVEASRAMHIGVLEIIRDDIVPRVMPYIMINFMSNTTRVIHASVGLYFLGVLPFTAMNWGVMINQAYNNGALLTLDGLHYLFIPTAAITLISYGVTIFSQGMDRFFNPRIRARHSKTTESSEDELSPTV